MLFRSKAVIFDGPEDYHERLNDPALGIDENTMLVIRGTGTKRVAWIIAV